MEERKDSQLDLRSSNTGYIQDVRKSVNSVPVEHMDNLLNNPAKFHQKLLQSGVVNSDYIEFLNELDASSKQESQNIDMVEKYFTAEIEKLKMFYEEQIQEVREESAQALNSLQSDNETLREKCELLSKQNTELQQVPSKGFPPRPMTTKNAFNRRSSEMSRQSQTQMQQSIQQLEDENLKLK